jgi:hypothetical protein
VLSWVSLGFLHLGHKLSTAHTNDAGGRLNGDRRGLELGNYAGDVIQATSRQPGAQLQVALCWGVEVLVHGHFRVGPKGHQSVVFEGHAQCGGWRGFEQATQQHGCTGLRFDRLSSRDHESLTGDGFDVGHGLGGRLGQSPYRTAGQDQAAEGAPKGMSVLHGILGCYRLFSFYCTPPQTADALNMVAIN